MTERDKEISAERLVDRSRDHVVYFFQETAIALHRKGAVKASEIIEDTASEFVKENRKVISVTFAKEKLCS
jgi:hypothetical protein